MLEIGLLLGADRVRRPSGRESAIAETVAVRAGYLVDVTTSASVDVVSAATDRWDERRDELRAGVDVALSGGFMEVRDDKVVVLADTAERSDEIDLVRSGLEGTMVEAYHEIRKLDPPRLLKAGKGPQMSEM